MKKVFPLIFFFSLTPLTLSAAVIVFLSSFKTAPAQVLISPKVVSVLSASTTSLEYFSPLPPPVGTIDSLISPADARSVLIKNYLDKYNSPLTPYSDYIFKISQQYGLDYGLIVAIAQCESNVCKKIPYGSYNCWGFGNGGSRFTSWEGAIEYVAKTLKEDYYDIGLVTPDQIMPKYVPPSIDKGGPWAKCVNQYLEELR